MHSVCLSVRLSLHALTLVNILQTSWILHIVFISAVEFTVEKMICMGLRVRVQRHAKVFDTLRRMERKFLKRISTYCTNCNEINVCHLDILKHVSYEKLFKYYIFFVYKFPQKFSNALRPMGGINFKAYFSKLILH